MEENKEKHKLHNINYKYYNKYNLTTQTHNNNNYIQLKVN